MQFILIPATTISGKRGRFSIRHEGDRNVQSIKGCCLAGTSLQRDEVEHDIDGDFPVLSAARGTCLDRLLKKRRIRDRLTPRFEVAVERRIWTIHLDFAELEVLLDRGKIVAAIAATELCEVILTLKSGDVGRSTRLHAFSARRCLCILICQQGGVRLPARSRDRGAAGESQTGPPEAGHFGRRCTAGDRDRMSETLRSQRAAAARRGRSRTSTSDAHRHPPPAGGVRLLQTIRQRRESAITRAGIEMDLRSAW